MTLDEWQELLTAHGWGVTVTRVSPTRTRIEATHSGAIAMVTGVRGTNGGTKINRYGLCAPDGKRRLEWYGLTNDNFRHFAANRTLLSHMRRRILTKCHCRKVRHPSEQAAQAVVLGAKIKRALKDNQTRGEKRVYRCNKDDRVWHTTSKERW